ncbi:MAG: hypothetical protein K9N47_05935 [Prosthecobacter sp.]|uniref:hypothetical protein n=1 Tax=Prosthecobacter sp. TaxID=1965333 RepID=UPI0025DF8914|nr:hypothetical protein [Prosthecobacter sp.]MCF7785642.1 hypothetical protein [Prosthecobacter sp.]
MSAYLVTREGQELGTFKTSKIENGLQTGFFLMSDLGWCEESGWQGVTEIIGSAKGAALMKSAGLNPDDFNPYFQPVAKAPAGDSGEVSPTIIAELTSTRPWVRFISVVMGIGCTLMILTCVFKAAEGASSLADKPGHHLSGSTQYLIAAAICVLFTFLILYPALRLNNYASNIARLAKTQSLTDLAAALTEQRRFWKFYGIMMFVSIAMFTLLIGAGKGFSSMSR